MFFQDFCISQTYNHDFTVSHFFHKISKMGSGGNVLETEHEPEDEAEDNVERGEELKVLETEPKNETESKHETEGNVGKGEELKLLEAEAKHEADPIQEQVAKSHKTNMTGNFFAISATVATVILVTLIFMLPYTLIWHEKCDEKKCPVSCEATFGLGCFAEETNAGMVF